MRPAVACFLSPVVAQDLFLASGARSAAEVADFTEFEDNFPEWAAQFKSGNGVGEYSYKKGNVTSLYGTTDTLISFFVLGLTENLTESDKDSWAQTINSFQDPDTGMYSHESWEGASTSPYSHATAFAVSALTLINRTAAYPLKRFLDFQADSSQWEPWITNRHSWDHRTSGTWAALHMTGQLDQNFSTWFFDWMRSEADPRSGGFVCPGKVEDKSATPQLKWMTCFVHDLWQFHAANETWSYPQEMVDWTLQMFNSSSGYFCISPGDSNPSKDCNRSPRSKGIASPVNPSCHQLDGLFTVLRSAELIDGYRWDEAREMCQSHLRAAAGRLNDKKVLMDKLPYGDTHGLNGGLQGIAECARFFPEMIKTRRPWRGSLDYASFM